MDKASTISNESKIFEMPSWESLKMTELLSFVATPVLLFIVAATSFRLWLKLNLFLAFFFGGLMVLYPEALLSAALQAKLDLHIRFIASLCGCYEIFSALYVLFLLPSKDDTVFIGYLWSNLIKFSLILVDNYFSCMYGDKWNYKLLVVGGFSAFSFVLTTVWFLFRSSHSRVTFLYRMTPINILAKVDFYLLFIAGLALYAYPSQLLRRFDIDNYHDGHLSLFRIAGIITMSLSFQSFGLPGFLYEKDKLRFIMSRLTGGLIEFIVLFSGYFYLKAITFNAFYSLAGVNVIYMLFLGVGYFICIKNIQELNVFLNDSNVVYSNEVTTEVVEEIVREDFLEPTEKIKDK